MSSSPLNPLFEPVSSPAEPSTQPSADPSTQPAAQDWRDAMFNPAQFQHCGQALLDLLSKRLTHDLAGGDKPLHWQPPQLAEQAWLQAMPEQPELSTEDLVSWLAQQVLPGNLAVHHPHSMGHQLAPPLPLAALCDLVASLANQAMPVYETGPTATLIERQVIRWLCGLLGWESSGNTQGHTQPSAGILTSGGAQANLTALLAARQHCQDVWRSGLKDVPRLRILTSSLAHYSISRAAGIMGLGTDAVLAVAVDEHGAMDVAELARLHASCVQHGERVMAVVASAGCTATGSIDPLLAIAQFCQAQQLWLHVDGAHGASALLSEHHAHKLQGIALADSVSWDGHKLLYMPAAVSAVLFRQAADSYLAFAQDASYLFHGDDMTLDFNTSYRTLECTKRMMGLKLLAAFKLYGRQGMAQLLDYVFALASHFADALEQAPDFELLMRPQTNIVCFRYRSELANSNELQGWLRLQLLERGAYHLSQVEIEGVLWLRCTLMNPYTENQHLLGLLESIRALANTADAQI